jgi:hypothetical protein
LNKSLHACEKSHRIRVAFSTNNVSETEHAKWCFRDDAVLTQSAPEAGQPDRCAFELGKVSTFELDMSTNSQTRVIREQQRPAF